MKLFTSVILIFLINSAIITALQNGERAVLARARFIASIRLRHLERERLGSGFICTATLINNYHVVSAASCVTHHLSSQLEVVLGVTDLSMRSPYAVTRNVLRMFFHPDFKRDSDLSEFYGNIAILQLSNSVRQASTSWSWIQKGMRNLHIQPIRTSSKYPNETSSSCWFFAWGRPSVDDEQSSHLLMANLPLISNNELCRESSTVFCAGDINNGAAALCNNLGGSMICDNTFFGMAITNSCYSPGHFHLIASSRDWISEASHANKLTISSLLAISLSMLTIFNL